MIEGFEDYKLFFTVFNDLSTGFSTELPPEGIFGYAFVLRARKTITKSWKRLNDSTLETSSEIPLDDIKQQVLEGFPHLKFRDFLQDAGFTVDAELVSNMTISQIIHLLLEEMG